VAANPGALVYGTVVVGALLAAESAQSETYVATLAGVAVALLAYWLARSYADYTGWRLSRSEPLKAAAFGRTLVGELSVLIGAAGPLLVLVLFWATGGPLGDAVTAAIWTAAAMIVVIELVAGLRAGLSGRELALQTALGAVIGALMIALKLVLH
jgi:hypothetical protein